MSRAYCSACLRPQVSCICHLIYPINNQIHVVVLQHPSEVEQAKGTVTLLGKSLSSFELFVGEDFSNHQGLIDVLSKYQNKTALLYPSETAEVINFDDSVATPAKESHIKCILLLDGTWKKAYRLYMMNSILHSIPHFMLSNDIKGEYIIRKVKKKGALSTLEACCYALSMLENKPSKYDGLFEQFRKFNEMLLSFKNRNE